MQAERTRRLGGRADGWTGQKGRGRSGGWGRKGREQSSGRADGAHEARTSGRGPTGRGRTDGRTSGRANGWTRRSGAEEAAVGQTRRMGRTCSPVVGADEWVGLGLKGHIPQGPFHSWAPSPLASSERKYTGCLGVQWDPVGFHVNHSYLALGFPCLV